jgi:hypothetical protein
VWNIPAAESLRLGGLASTEPVYIVFRDTSKVIGLATARFLDRPNHVSDHTLRYPDTILTRHVDDRFHLETLAIPFVSVVLNNSSLFQSPQVIRIQLYKLATYPEEHWKNDNKEDSIAGYFGVPLHKAKAMESETRSTVIYLWTINARERFYRPTSFS